MAIKSTPKLLQSFRRQITRTLSSPSTIPVLPFNLGEKPEPTILRPDSDPTRQHPPSIIDFNDTRKLFSSFSTTKLLTSAINLNMAAYDPVVDLGIRVMRSKLMDTPVIRDVILGVVRRTFYEQFVAGKDLKETGRTVERIWEAGLRSMLVYGLEHAYDNRSCDENFMHFLQTVEHTKFLPTSSVSTYAPTSLVWKSEPTHTGPTALN